MTRNRVLIGGVIVLLMGLAAAAWLYDFVLGETEEAGGPIAAIPLELDTPAPASAPATTAALEPTEISVTPTEAEAAAATETEAVPTEAEVVPTETEAVPTEVEATETDAGNPAGPVIFRIIQDESRVSFTLSEVLRGEPAVVLGITDQVAGEIAVDFSDLSTAQVGIIQINARTLATDNSRRNQMIRNRILNTNTYEFITFTPTEIVGLSGSALLGEAVTFQIVGDLTIRDITNRVTFEATISPVSDTRLEGVVSTTILRGDYNLVIPSVPGVADVSEEVVLEINFVATS